MATNNFDRKKETASFRVEKEILFVFFLPNEGHAHLPNKSPVVANGKKSAPIQTESVSITEQIRAKQTNKPTNKRTAPAIERRSAAESGRVPFLFDQKKKRQQRCGCVSQWGPSTKRINRTAASIEPQRNPTKNKRRIDCGLAAKGAAVPSAGTGQRSKRKTKKKEKEMKDRRP